MERALEQIPGISFSEAIAYELIDKNITVTALCPGATSTGFSKAANLENSILFNKSAAKASSVAECGYKAMIKGLPVVIHGLLNKLLIIFSKFMPRKLILKITYNITK